MKVLLTGATGFIGSQVAKRLLHDRHEVYPLPRPWKIPAGPFDACIHLAWYVEPGKYLESPLNHQCVADSLALARALVESKCPRLIAAGTCFETESPDTLYAQSKLKLFRELQQFPLNLAWLRFFYLYGPQEYPGRLVPYVIRSLLQGNEVKLTPGEQVRDFLHVSDVASAIVSVAQSPLTGIVNIGSGEPVTVRKIAETIGEIVGRTDLLKFGAKPYAPNDPMSVVADNTRLRSTGWQPRFTLETGLRDTVQWWQSQDNTR
jgi:nucleoside-diphosphate-sugar epimerase